MRWLLLVPALTACYAARPPEGALCGDGGVCPSGQQCRALDNRCYFDVPPLDLDAPLPPIDASPDASVFGTTCVPRRLLTGGTDVAAQGWATVRTGGTITYAAGVTTLATAGDTRQMIVLRDAFPPDRWSLHIVAEIVKAGGHAVGNASIGMMASFHDPAGDANDVKKMVFVDEAAFGFAEGGSIGGAAFMGQIPITIERPAGGGIKASVGNGGSISTAAFTSNGTVAIGDQSTMTGLDSTLRLFSVDLTCP